MVSEEVSRSKRLKGIKKPFCLLLSIFLFGLCVSISKVYADVHIAETPSYADVSKAVADAEPGDTVFVKVGTATWNNTLTIDKSIVLMGAGADLTKIVNDNFTNQSLIRISPVSDVPVRVTGFYFDMVVNSGAPIYNDAIRVVGTKTGSYSLTKIRIDHNTFNKGQSQVWWTGWTYGVMDHNTFMNGEVTVLLIGDSSHAYDRPIAPGTANAVHIESNTFIADRNYGSGRNDQFVYHQDGARSVTRYNTFDTRDYTKAFCFLDSHGNWGDPITTYRGQPMIEVYGNSFASYETYNFFDLRGGSVLIYNNIFTMIQPGTPEVIDLWEEECWSSGSPFCPSCPVTTVWPAWDQINNSFFWDNTFNGSPVKLTFATPVESTTFFLESRDYWLHPPAATGGRTVYTGQPGGNEVFVSTGPNAYYPYIPYPYPHPLSVQGETGRLLNLHKAAAPGQVNLDWDAISGATGYGVSRDWGAVAPISNTTYTDNNPVQVYIVYAYDSGGKIIAMEGVNTDDQAPSAPINLHAPAVTSYSVTLAWDASHDNFGVIGYRVYQGENSVSVANVAGLTATILNLNATTPYSFTVAAYDAGGNESAKSDPVTATTSAGFTISGQVTLNGAGLTNVVMGGLPTLIVTNAGGEYTATVDQGWSGTVTPILSGYTFTPPSTTYSGVTSNQTRNYTAALSSGGGDGDSGGGGGGGGCFIATVAHGSVQWSGLLPLFLLGIGLVGWNFGKRKTL
jgi:chitodextrinase